MTEPFIIECPWCFGTVEVERDQINCKIFRHGALKQNGQQINQHLPETQCIELKRLDLIWGCGKPFIFDGSVVVRCGYI